MRLAVGQKNKKNDCITGIIKSTETGISGCRIKIRRATCKAHTIH